MKYLLSRESIICFNICEKLIPKVDECKKMKQCSTFSENTIKKPLLWEGYLLLIV